MGFNFFFHHHQTNVHRWIPGGKGSSSSSSRHILSSPSMEQQQRQTKTKRRAAMGPVPRDVRGGVLEMVVGKGACVQGAFGPYYMVDGTIKITTFTYFFLAALTPRAVGRFVSGAAGPDVLERQRGAGGGGSRSRISNTESSYKVGSGTKTWLESQRET